METDNALVQAVDQAAFVFPMVILERVAGETSEVSGNLERDVRRAFPQVIVEDLLTALDRLETEPIH